MYDLESFDIVDLEAGNSYMTITQNSITFSKGLIERIGRVPYVRLLIKEKEGLLAIKATDEYDDRKIDFYRPGIVRVRWNNREFATRFIKLAGFPKEISIKVVGEYIGNERAFVFNLKKAEPIIIID